MLRDSLLFATLLLVSCASAPPPARNIVNDPTEPGAPESSYTPPARVVEPSAPVAPAGPVAPVAAYACPMHPDARSATAGRCPACGMALVPSPTPPATENPR